MNCQQTWGTKVAQTFERRWHVTRRKTKVSMILCCERWCLAWNGWTAISFRNSVELGHTETNFIFNSCIEYMMLWKPNICQWPIGDVHSYSIPLAPTHTAKGKVDEHEELDVASQPAYGQDLARSDYHLFWVVAHLLQGLRFNNLDNVENERRGFWVLTSKSSIYYRFGIDLAKSWKISIQYDGIFVDE